MTRFVICGPPGSGKTTWVRERARPGDLVWDFDDVAAVVANCGAPMPREARGSMDQAVIGARP